ncbi:MAG: RNase adapter RapZ [Planctomycetes bacterium]|nr:RNase adapter RapZ [Planctomycetota bacterium]MCC7170011.1 RNase adapter RapZ [Planctomycetota bacterium]
MAKPAKRDRNRLVFVTGLSGAGKSGAVKCFEDMGFFCSDNVPVTLIPAYLEELRARRESIPRVALVVDVREGEFLNEFIPLVAKLRAQEPRPHVVYLEASDEALLRRFSETKRPHPLALDSRAEDGIKKERALLENVRNIADMILDTSNFNQYQLREHLMEVFEAGNQLVVSVLSFGFKFGIPLDCDLVFDVRFLKNPHYVPSLKKKTGEDEDVQRYVLADPEAGRFLKRLIGFVKPLLPLYIREGKAYLNVGIGCTGGKHRSVVMARELAKALVDRRWAVHITHRDAAKDA